MLNGTVLDTSRVLNGFFSDTSDVSIVHNNFFYKTHSTAILRPNLMYSNPSICLYIDYSTSDAEQFQNTKPVLLHQ